MSLDGWVKLHRKLQETSLWTCEKFSRGQAWVDLIMLANHEESFFYKRGVKVDVLRGQVARSEVELADRWLWSRTKVRRFLDDLEKEQQIIQQKNNVIQILTIIKYDEYQKKEQQNGQQKDSRKTAEKHIQECKEGEECKEGIEDIVGQEPRQRPQIPYSDIVSFLNEKAGTAFKQQTQSTKSHIRARWAEGFRLEDFKAVIEHKTDEWKTDSKMCEFLRPVTLFGTKFESYLQAAKAGAGQENLYGRHGKWTDKRC